MPTCWPLTIFSFYNVVIITTTMNVRRSSHLHLAAALGLIAAFFGMAAQGARGRYDFTTTQLREYYIAAVEVEWDYAPTGRNVIKDREITPGSHEGQFLLNRTHRIGRKYKKAIYKQYTDDTYTTEIQVPEWHGSFGPILYAETGDTMFVYFKNMASRPFTMHPHGVKYFKDSEGAKYEDNTSGEDKEDDLVEPGDTYLYKWFANEAAGPAADDENCTPWPYHSHILSPSGISSGMTGALVICREGILDEAGKRRDVDQDFLLVFSITDENLSYYLDDNIATYAGSPETLDPDDEDFAASNLMDGINGRLYGNLPGLTMCVGDKVSWNVLAFGTEADIHTVHFHGNILNFQGRRRDSLSLSPAILMSAEMEAINPGTWLITSASTNHFSDGSQVLYTVSAECGTAPTDNTPAGIQRNYYIAAEEIDWDYAPDRAHSDGTNFTNPDSDSYPFFTKDNNRLGGIYKKAKFVAYTNDSFITKAPEDPLMGLLGPVIRAEVGDIINVTLRNNLLSQNVSITPHGVMYTKNNEGDAYNDGTTGGDRFDEMITPGTIFSYIWTVPEHVGPTDVDPDCITWIYLSTADPVGDISAGLVGPLLVCKRGTLDPDTGKQTQVDKEYFLLFSTFDENLSWLIDENIQNYSADPGSVDKSDELFTASNQMSSLNGLSYNNLMGLTAIVGDRVSWHIMAIGDFTNEHGMSVRGHTLLHNSRRTSSVEVFPGVSETAYMDADIPGIFQVSCETNSHLVEGMMTILTVQDKADQAPPTVGSKKRSYFVAIAEEYWDYAETKWDPVRSESLTDPKSVGYVFVAQGDLSIGSRYKKARYREYTDATFRMEKQRTTEDMHLGVLGPLLHMEVGETVTIVVKNTASRQYGLEPFGVLVSTNDTVNERGIAPGATKTYQWKVPDRSGPSATDPNCIVYAYYSHINKEMDTNSGLIGPMVVCHPGILGENGRRQDVDREIALLFTVLDENKSWYLDDNIQEFCGTPSAVDKADGDFEESNLMHGINGFLFSNLHHLDVEEGSVVEWYLLGIGDEVDVHSVHFHGQTVTYRTSMVHRVDVFELFPGVFGSVQMKADNPGKWLMHCHVHDHILGGMETEYTVHASGETTATAPSTTSTACCITDAGAPD
ncbi:hephaestin-like protein isoform X2 [Asterias rubens]|uniref:hephaestin-like protein isoform X2 n=1 Tax=Asterias rubens TaxID=7604 RepID=UPI00145577CB|nr:hephaestin-like protein isoform X2 [Asterias rubens]